MGIGRLPEAMPTQERLRNAGTSLTLKRIPCGGPAEAFLIGVSAFPMPAAEVESVGKFLKIVAREAAARWRISPQAFFPIHALADTRSTERLTAHAPQWL